MTTTLEELERRVTVLETRMRANEASDNVIYEKLNGILATQDRMLGTQDMMMGMLRDHGRLLATHNEQLADLGGKMDMVVTWIQNQP